MLTYSELVTLERSIRDARVLSVYLDAAPADVAAFGTRALRLDHLLDGVRARASHGSREDQQRLERCERLLRDDVAVLPPGTSTSSWAAFVTEHGVVHSSALPIRVADSAVWHTGACVTPYLSAIPAAASAIVAVLDARRAVVYHYDGEALDRGEIFHAHHAVAPPAHMGDVPNAGFHSGTRGTTGHDAAQRALRAGTVRMLRTAMDRAVDIAGADEPILLGGISRVVAHAAHALEELGDRVIQLDALDVHATAPQIIDVARDATTAYRDLVAERDVRAALEQADANGLGVQGPSPTRHALLAHAVHTLFVSAAYVERRLTHADAVTHLALGQDARVRIVSGEAARILDARGGIAARLRFREAPATAPATPATIGYRASA